MLKFKYATDPNTGETILETSLTGKSLLCIPQLNKDTAFTEQERQAFGLIGKLPPCVDTLEQQVNRAYAQYNAYQDSLQKNIYLNNLNDKNQVVFYKLVSDHLSEMVPAIYTPIVGTAVKSFSQEFRRPRGLYISYENIEEIDSILENRSNPEIDVIVVTDGEGILGIGDQGIGGIDIPIAKLMIYSLLGGIDPNRTLPIMLDVGTNNQALLDDPLYLGNRHPRIEQEKYDAFIAKFVESVQRHFPKAFLHWEDLGTYNAQNVLKNYRQHTTSFNDDIQGTGVVTTAAILAAIKVQKTKIADQRIVVLGAGTAGLGITHQIQEALHRAGLSEAEARKKFWLVDRAGLLIDSMEALPEGQRAYARSQSEIDAWDLPSGAIGLAEVVKQVKPTILIGCSTVTGAFTEPLIKRLCEDVQRPIIFPLSNPTERSEATAKDLIEWSKGQAIVATGSPFDAVVYDNLTFVTAQSNNALAFPGIGLGMKVSGATQLTDNMLWAASEALCNIAPAHADPTQPVLPMLSEGRQAAKAIAAAVCVQAIEDGVATHELDVSTLEETLEQAMWTPAYVPFRYVSTVR